MIPMSCQALTLKASILMTHSLQGSSRAITQLHFPQSFIQLDIPIFIKHNIAELFLFPSGLFQVPLICSELFCRNKLDLDLPDMLGFVRAG